MADLGAKHFGKHRFDHVLAQLGEQPVMVDFGIMLGRHQNRVQTDRPVLLVVFDGHLGLAIRTQMRDDTVLAHLGQAEGQPMRQIYRQRHQRFGLVGCIPEHHALIAGALGLVALLARGSGLLLGIQTRHTLVDFFALFAQRHHHAAGISIQADLGARIADIAYHVTHDALDIAVSFAGHLAEDEELALGGRRLHGDMRMRVLPQHIVQNRVRNLVADLVRMPFSDGFRRNQATLHIPLAVFPSNVRPRRRRKAEAGITQYATG